ncbi:MAG: hypothetical protein PUP91_15865 [Rhizonema sp. PD37]|nr:hypothetical protein [Rhizonema sp. PD37]
MKQQPTLQTQRLVLRPFNSTDVKQLQQLASAYEIAATTLSIPHPYPDNIAQQWIETGV